MNQSPFNADRAERADVALAAYAQFRGEPRDESDLADLLTDLMHWCDANDTSFDDSIDTAVMNYNGEIVFDDIEVAFHTWKESQN